MTVNGVKWIHPSCAASNAPVPYCHGSAAACCRRRFRTSRNELQAGFQLPLAPGRGRRRTGTAAGSSSGADARRLQISGARSEVLRLLRDKRAVQEEQRLLRNRRDEPHRRVLIGRREVEALSSAGNAAALDEAVNGPPRHGRLRRQRETEHRRRSDPAGRQRPASNRARSRSPAAAGSSATAS